MAVLRTKEIRKMDKKDLDKRMQDMRIEIAKERANTAIGAAASSPGKIREIRRSIARIKTIRMEGSKQ